MSSTPTEAVRLRKVIEGFSNGDNVASKEFRTLLSRWTSSLARQPLNGTHPPEVVDEVVQNVLVRLWKSPEKLQQVLDAENLPAYVRKVIWNEIKTYYRAQTRQREKESLPIDEVSQALEDSHTQQQCEAIELQDTVDQLAPTEEDREVIWMRIDEDRTFKEISQIVERPFCQVYSRFQKVMIRLGNHQDFKDAAPRSG